MNCDRANETLKAIEAEYLAARFAFKQALQLAAPIQEPGFSRRDLERCDANAEVTDRIRLFTQFEALIRRCWARVNPKVPTTSRLLARIATHVKMPPEVVDDVHAVRQYRNDVAHGGSTAERVSLSTARGRLCRYLSHLPRAEW